MQRIKIVSVMAMLIAGFFFLKHLNAHANAPQEHENPQQSYARARSLSSGPQRPQSTDLDAAADAADVVDRAPEIQATRRISIPFGFQTPLPVLADGRDVLASGHGGCTAEEQVTIAITITQSTSGAVATGEKVQTCTGELQLWDAAVSSDTTSSFTNGAAEACGLATTRNGGYVTDTFDWCRDVDLLRLEQRIFLPSILKP
jgi:hypothetical protein